MDLNWNKIGAYAIGGAFGAALGVFTAKFVMDVMEAQREMREVEEMDEEESVEPKQIVEEKTLTNGWKLKTDNRVNYSGSKDELSSIISKYKKTGEEIPNEPSPVEYVDEMLGGPLPVEKTAVVDRSKPYPISADEFAKGGNHPKPYRVMKIFFYAGDEICTDSANKPLVKPEKFLGTDLINKFGGTSGDPLFAYIRNEGLKVDYHVVYIDDFFEEEDESPRRARSLNKKNGDE